MTFPVIHLNGSSKSYLEQQYRDAATAVRRARDVVAQNGPHGRDYYTLPGDAFGEARKEHEARLKRLREVTEELEQIWEEVSK